jgi:hypothetical protein
MAVPIELKRIRLDSSSEIKAKLEASEVKHAEAILALHEFAQELHDAGLIDLGRGFVRGGGDIITRLSEAMNTPEAIQGIRNFITLTRMFATMDTKVLHQVERAGAVAGGILSGVSAFARVLTRGSGRK